MVSRMYFCLGLSILIISNLFPSAKACTTVFWNNNAIANVVARTMDLSITDSPRLVVYPRGISRSGEAGSNSLTWKSKYGSVVVTAFNSNAVSDGLNEYGLAAHLLYLSNTKYPTRKPELPAISNVLWAQYILDNYKTVNEVLTSLPNAQIVAPKIREQVWPLYLTIEDKSGDAAIIEYIDGKIKVLHGPQFRITTNEADYNRQITNLKQYKAFGGAQDLPGEVDSLSRFIRAASYLKTLPLPKDNSKVIAQLFSVIRTVMVPFGAIDTSQNKTENAWPTRWVVLADMSNKVYYFNSATTLNFIWLDFKNLNFSELSPALEIDPNKLNLAGEVSNQLIKRKIWTGL